MPAQSSDKTQRATDQTAGAADRTAEAARAATDAGAEATRQGAEGLQEQMSAMLGTTGRVSQEAARRTSENLELMKRMAETMMSGAREASSETVEWTRQVAERQAEATRQITQARDMEEILDIQNRYIRDNLQALLDLSAKVSRLSADKATEASGHLKLAGRAYAQAQKFGAKVMIAEGATELTCDRAPRVVRLDDGATIRARTVIIATGARYRRPSFANLGKFEGAGVYHNATFMEAQLCESEEVIVVGGANSAGQAALFLAQAARRVRLLVRSHSLSESMSRYLIRRIEETPAIQLRTRTEIVALEGDGHLESVQWRDGTNTVSRHDIRHVFLMTGADANTEWLQNRVALDGKGFIKSGPDLTNEDLAAAQWPLERAPYLLETSLPGVFAVGDVRCGNIKRVASAVGEGSIAISFVHRVLAES